jgi:diguanylate cyclase (GGDEF)-like protein/PAS domain S-box-containing protein
VTHPSALGGTLGGWAEGATDLVGRFTTDGECLYVSPAATAILGHDPGQLVGRSVFDFVPEDDHAHLGELCAAAVEGRPTAPVRHRVRRSDGQTLWIETTAWLIGSETDSDGSELATFSRSIDASVSRGSGKSGFRPFEAAFDHAPIGAVIVDLDGRLVRVNRALCRITGYEAEVLEQLRIEDITEPTDLGADLALAGQLLRGDLEHFEFDKRYPRADGSFVWLRLTVSVVRDDAERPLHFVAYGHDVTAARAEQARLQQLALHDSLTGLPNRVLLLDRLQQVLAAADRRQTLTGVVYCDLDGFKEVNDRYGHPVGDTVLADIAQRLAHALRPADTVARVGGDEFVAVCPDLRDSEELAGIANRLERALHGAGFADAPVGMSVGSILASPGEAADVVLARADEAMYRSKRSPR